MFLFINCATHHNAGGFALGQWLDTMGIDCEQSIKAGTWNISEHPGTSNIRIIMRKNV